MWNRGFLLLLLYSHFLALPNESPSRCEMLARLPRAKRALRASVEATSLSPLPCMNFQSEKKSFSFQDPMLFSSAKLHYGLTQILPERSTDRKVAKTSTDNYSPVLAAMFSRKKSPLDRCCRPKVCAILSEMVPFPEPGGPMITARKILDISSEHFGTLDQITVVLKKRAIKARVTSDSTIVSIQYMTHLHRR